MPFFTATARPDQQYIDLAVGNDKCAAIELAWTRRYWVNHAWKTECLINARRTEAWNFSANIPNISVDGEEVDKVILDLASAIQTEEVRPFVQRPITSFFKPSPGSSASPAQEASSLRDVLRRQGWPSILCLQEIKIHEDDESTKATVERTVTSADGNAEPSYKTFFCLPCDRYNARGFGRKIYGVCTLIRIDFFDKVVNNVRTVDWDAEGRFLVCETRASGMMPRLAIINVYAVNGTEAPYKDPQTGEPAGTRHDRKLQVHKRLQSECRALEQKGFACIVAGDLNIARRPIDGHPNLRTFPKRHCLNREDFEARFFGNSQQGGTAAAADDQALGFIDTFRHVHGESRPGYTYYPRGKPFGSSCDRVDMILVSQSLKASLQAAGICETPADRGSSDHVPLWCTLGFEGE